MEYSDGVDGKGSVLDSETRMNNGMEMVITGYIKKMVSSPVGLKDSVIRGEHGGQDWKNQLRSDRGRP